MNYKLEKFTYLELRDLAKQMDLKSRRSKSEYIDDITAAFSEYEKYKNKKLDKYKKIKQICKGKEGPVYLVSDKSSHNYVMKCFKKSKSTVKLKLEYELQKRAATVGISPRVVEKDTVSKYIIMEKMDSHLISKNDCNLTKGQQLELINIYKQLDSIKIFHGDTNIMNYMIKNNKIYIVDFSTAKDIDEKLVKKLGTDTPNISMMTLGFILKLKELRCSSSCWKYLKKYLDDSTIDKYNL